MYKIYYSLLTLIFSVSVFSQELTKEIADHLASLPLKCIQQEYPNKPSEVLNDTLDIKSPRAMHPAFYGCFDWHSAVHGHWSLVYLLNNFEHLSNKDVVLLKLKTNLSKKNILGEIAYFNKKNEKTFERTYGWAWLLKLQQELNQSKNADLQIIAKDLKPLSDLLVARYIDYMPKLLYPLRNGTHSNTAFGLSFAWDYAKSIGDEKFQKEIKNCAVRLFAKDTKATFDYEPSGTDFLSSNLEEIAIMDRIYSKADFLVWLKKFHNPILNKGFDLKVGLVADRTDGTLVHLDGLNFSRAWNMYRLAKDYPKELGHLKSIAKKHLDFSMKNLADGNYEGEHWLGSFVMKVFEEIEK